MRAFIIIYLLLIGCDVTHHKSDSIIPNYNKDLDHISAELIPYLEDAEYILNYKSKIKGLRFIHETEMDGLSKSIKGICIHKTNVILLQEDTWKRASKEWRLAILIHELGHCDFNKDHTKTTGYECDGNLMNPWTNCTYEAFMNKTKEDIRNEIQN